MRAALVGRLDMARQGDRMPLRDNEARLAIVIVICITVVVVTVIMELATCTTSIAY